MNYMKKKNLQINKTYIFTIIIMLFYFKPYYINYKNYNSINSIYVTGLRIIFLLGTVIYIKKNRISKFMISLIVFYIIRFLTTMFNNGDISVVLSEIYTVFGACMCIELLIRRNIKEFLKGLRLLILILFGITIFTIIKDPIGYGTVYEKIYFQRPGNQIGSFIILCLLIILIYSKLYKGKNADVISWLSIIAAFYISVNVGSASGILAVVVIFLYYISNKIIWIDKLIDFKNIIFGYLIFYIAIVIFKVQYKFSDIIIEILGKDLTFTGRTELWEVAKEIINKNFILGVGTQSTTNIIYDGGKGTYLSTHNQILQLLVENGVVILIGVFLILYFVNKSMNKNNNNNIVLVSSISILAMLIVLFSEAMGVFDLFIALSLIYNINLVLEGEVIKYE